MEAGQDLRHSVVSIASISDLKLTIALVSICTVFEPIFGLSFWHFISVETEPKGPASSWGWGGEGGRGIEAM